MKGLGGPLALIAAAAWLVVALLPWTAEQRLADWPISLLWGGASGSGSLLLSLAAVAILVAVVFVASAVSGSRALSVFGVLLGGALIVLWTTRTHGVSPVTDYLLHGSSYGLWVAVVGLAFGVAAALTRRSF